MAGALLPLLPNTNPHSKHIALCPPGLSSIISTLKRDAWEYYLSEYLDWSFVDFILNIIDVGASMGHMALLNLKCARNLQSATDFPGNISKEIESLCSLMHIHSPFPDSPSVFRGLGIY